MGTRVTKRVPEWVQTWHASYLDYSEHFFQVKFFGTQWVPMGTHHPIAMKMKICLLIGCLGPSVIFCIFLSDQQEKSLFSDSADPSIFSDKMAVTSVLLYLLLL